MGLLNDWVSCLKVLTVHSDGSNAIDPSVSGDANNSSGSNKGNPP